MSSFCQTSLKKRCQKYVTLEYFCHTPPQCKIFNFLHISLLKVRSSEVLSPEFILPPAMVNFHLQSKYKVGKRECGWRPKYEICASLTSKLILGPFLMAGCCNASEGDAPRSQSFISTCPPLPHHQPTKCKPHNPPSKPAATAISLQFFNFQPENVVCTQRDNTQVRM